MIIRGKFGTILVTDGPKSRRLYINRELQGGALFYPGADTVAPELSGPGPVSEAKYALGWLIAGKANPMGSFLMIGLGSGAGATQLLANFPEVDLTVVEIDPAMVEAATTSFPLLNYYADQGRLNIVVQDAKDFFEEHDWQWDAGLADAYTGQSYDLETGYFPGLCRSCLSLYVNVIGKFADDAFLRVADLMDEYGHQPMAFFQPNQLAEGGINADVISNWMLVSDDLDIYTLSQWQPFPQYTNGEADGTRKQWIEMLGTGIILD
jgi:hypothetical protein